MGKEGRPGRGVGALEEGEGGWRRCWGGRSWPGQGEKGGGGAHEGEKERRREVSEEKRENRGGNLN